MALSILFASGKGGTGKTTACSSLGSFLARSGARVICADTDPLRGLDIALGVADRVVFELADALNGYCKLSDALYETDAGGYALRYCRVGDLGGQWPFVAENLKRRCDWLLIDAPAGIDALPAADYAIYVVNADDISTRAATSVRSETDAFERIIINKVNGNTLRRQRRTLDDTIDRTGMRLLGYIPEDAEVQLAMAQGVPLAYYGSPLRRGNARIAFATMSRRLEDEAE